MKKIISIVFFYQTRWTGREKNGPEPEDQHHLGNEGADGERKVGVPGRLLTSMVRENDGVQADCKSYNWSVTSAISESWGSVLFWMRLTLVLEYGPNEAVIVQGDDQHYSLESYGDTDSQAAKVDVPSGSTYSAASFHKRERGKGESKTHDEKKPKAYSKMNKT